MGTHPIFESDFDCLTDCKMAEVGAAGDQGQVKQEVDELAKQVDDIVVDEKKEEKQSRPKVQVLSRGITGKIKWFNIPHGYGFIEREDNEADVFVHQSAVVRPGKKPRFSLYLKGGESVEFDVVQGLKGLEAVAVTAPGGYELATQSAHKGQRNLRRKYYRRSQRKPKTDENANVIETQEVKAQTKEE